MTTISKPSCSRPRFDIKRLSRCYYSRQKSAIKHSTEGRILIRVWVFVYTYASAKYKSQHSILYSQHHYSLYFFFKFIITPGFFFFLFFIFFFSSELHIAVADVEFDYYIDPDSETFQFNRYIIIICLFVFKIFLLSY